MIRKILVTGAAGFIGAALVERLSRETIYDVTATDFVKSVDVALPTDTLKLLRLKRQRALPYVTYDNCNITDYSDVERLFSYNNYDMVIHLAAETGVLDSNRYPNKYTQANLVGFQNVIEMSARCNVGHFIYASSSSVYGIDAKLPMNEEATAITPVSYYASTKRSNELTAYSYSHSRQLKTTGLRFFTVYGPRSRLDMAPYRFASAILNDEPVQLYNFGQNTRDFTHVDDVVRAITATLQSKFQAQTDAYTIVNVGNGHPISTKEFINDLEVVIGKTANKIFAPGIPGDVINTFACTDEMYRLNMMKRDPYPHNTRRQRLVDMVNWIKLFETIYQAPVSATTLSV